MVDLDAVIEKLEKHIGTLKAARELLNGHASGASPKPRVAVHQKRRYSHVTPLEVKRMKVLRSNGRSLEWIARATNRSVSVVSTHLSK